MEHGKILIVDDEAYVRKTIRVSLQKEYFEIFEASCGQDALELIHNQGFDLIILDIMMGDLSGFDVLKTIRDMGVDSPILLLSARIEDHDKILGFGLGADDYISKPFSPAVLSARVKAHIRRNKELLLSREKSTRIIQDPFLFNLKTYKFYKDNIEIPLSSKETMLMKFFMENPNQVFSKEQLYQNIWGDTIIDDNAIMVYIRHLRIKIEDDPKKPKYIHTVWGIGYKFLVE